MQLRRGDSYTIYVYLLSKVFWFLAKAKRIISVAALTKWTQKNEFSFTILSQSLYHVYVLAENITNVICSSDNQQRDDMVTNTSTSNSRFELNNI